MGVPIKRKKRKKKPIQIGFGFYLFSIMFVYMLIRIIMSVNNVDTGVFQVEESSYDTDFKKTGIILRNEKLKTSTSSGYVCYYIREVGFRKTCLKHGNLIGYILLLGFRKGIAVSVLGFIEGIMHGTCLIYGVHIGVLGYLLTVSDVIAYIT